MIQITLDLVRARIRRHVPRRLTVAATAREASVALLLAPGALTGLDLLLIKRAEHPGDRWSGQIALPGGRREPTDEDPQTTAIRETREAVGITVEPGWLVGQLDDLQPRTPTLPPILVRPYVFGLPSRPAVALNREATSYVWVPLAELAGGRTRTEITVPWRVAPFPAYRVGDDVLWGMTERIVTPIIELLHQTRPLRPSHDHVFCET